MKEESGPKGTVLHYCSNVDILRVVVEEVEVKIENDETRSRKRGRDDDEVSSANKKHKSANIPPMKPDLEEDSLTLGGAKLISREYQENRKYSSRKEKTTIQIKGQKKLMDCWKSQGKSRIHSKSADTIKIFYNQHNK